MDFLTAKANQLKQFSRSLSGSHHDHPDQHQVDEDTQVHHPDNQIEEKLLAKHHPGNNRFKHQHSLQVIKKPATSESCYLSPQVQIFEIWEDEKTYENFDKINKMIKKARNEMCHNRLIYFLGVHLSLIHFLASMSS